MNFRHIFWALLTFWCAAWPVFLVWAATQGYVVAAVLCIVVTAATPLLIFGRMRTWLERQSTEHQACHAEFQDLYERVQVMSSFRGFEMAACELELLSEGVETLTDVYLDPQSLARAIEERVRYLRSVAPVPPAVPLQALLAEDEES